MKKIEFENSLDHSLKQIGLKYIKKAYYCENDELIIVISPQKSSFDNSYYINYGFLIRKLSPDLKYPKENSCDVRGRFGFMVHDRVVYDFNLENNTVEQLKTAINTGIHTIILPVLNEGLTKYYELFPEAIASATLKAKEYRNNH